MRDVYRNLANILQEFVIDRGIAGTIDVVVRIFGLLIRFPAHRRLTKALSGRTTRYLLERYPRIAYRHASPYLFQGASWAERLEMMRSHYAFLNRTHDVFFFNRVIDRHGLEVWNRAIDDHRFSIALQGPDLESFHREGDLSLVFNIDGIAIFKIAFSIVPTHLFDTTGHSQFDSSHSIYIGQVQGVPDQWERVRTATRLCHAVAPQDLLINAVAGVATGWEIDRILGVRASRQLAACGPEASSVAFDYTGFWARYQAARTIDGHHLVPLPLPQKPIESIVGRHRKRTLAKRQFKDALTFDVMTMIVKYRSGRMVDPR